MNDDNLLRLDEICKKYFNIAPKNARRKAALNTLPVPAYRLTSSGKGPFYVSKDVLETYLTARIANATRMHREMASV